MSNDMIILLAKLADEEKASELLDIIGEGVVDTVGKAGAALELYNLGTGATFADSVAALRETQAEHGKPQALAWQWLQENHPELF